MKLSTTLTLAAVATTITAQNNFVGSCDRIAFRETSELAPAAIMGNCIGLDSTRKYTTLLDLNQCVGNFDGNLIGQKNGNAFSSCSQCSLVGVSTIGCSCTARDGHQITTYFDLNAVIGNDNGNLVCWS